MRWLAIAIIHVLFAASVCAQSPIVQHLEHDVAGQGKITVEQDARLDQWLLEGKPVNATPSTATPGIDEQLTTADSPKNMVARSGYRIQIYSGPASRDAKNAATAAAVKSRQVMPDLEAYAMFVSPRWLCVVGDFITREEAEEARERLQKTGEFGLLTIVRSQVFVTTTNDQ